MSPRRGVAFFALFVLSASWSPGAAAAEVEVRVSPASVAVPGALRVSPLESPSSEPPVVVPVRGGRALLPPSLRDPGILIEAEGFEAIRLPGGRGPYPSVLLLKALGYVEGRFEGVKKSSEQVTWISRLAASDGEPWETGLTLDEKAAFRLGLSEGIYDFIVLREGFMTRMSRGVPVKSGEVVSIGVVSARAAAQLSAKLADSRSRAPITGAKIIWEPDPRTANAKPSKAFLSSRLSTQSDRSGRFSIKDLPERVRFRIEAPGYQARIWSTTLTSGHRRDEGAIALDPYVALVVKTDLPAALATQRLRLSLFRFNEESASFLPVSERPVSTDAAEARFERLSFGRHRVVLRSAAGQLITFTDFSVQTDHQGLLLVPREKAVEGVVTSRGRPVANARVVAAYPSEGALLFSEEKTDEDGHFRVGLYFPGRVLVSALTDVAVKSEEVDLSERDEASIKIEIPTHGIRGIVRDRSSKRPIVSASIVCIYADRDLTTSMADETRTDENGLFSLEGLAPGAASVRVSARGYRSELLDVATTETDSEGPFLVELEKSPALSGVVLDESGHRVAGARLESGYPRVMGYHRNPLFSARSDAEGRFSMDSPPSEDSLFYVFAAGFALAVESLSPERENRIVLTRPVGSAATLLNKTGEPLAGVEVHAGVGSRPFPRGALEGLAEVNGLHPATLLRTAPDGQCLLPRFLAPGRYAFFVRRDPQPGELEERFYGIGGASLPVSGPLILTADPRP